MTNKSTRNRRRIRAWMIRKGITGVEIAKELQVSNALVCSTIGGQRNNRKVLNFLKEAGCPTKILVLPEDMIHCQKEKIPTQKQSNPEIGNNSSKAE